jgi:D-alanine-D-alanine ligase
MKTVAVIFGGQSVEHDVSIVTALASVVKPLELTGKYKVVATYISKDGKWYTGEKLKDITLFSSGLIDDYIAKQQPTSVLLGDGLSFVATTKLKRKTTNIDIVFPAMHGTKGEDGSLMGLLEMASVPYVGCGLSASVLAMDKVLSKLQAEAHGIPTPSFLHFSKATVDAEMDAVIQACMTKLNFPLFVKPPHLGSSIGISRVADKSELRNAIELAVHYDNTVLIEEAVNNLVEVTLPIMGNENPVPALLESPLTKSEDFFDFDTKYLQGGKKGKGAFGYSELPAKLSKDLYKKAETIGLSVYKALGCSGTARVDMLIDTKTQQVYFNEVNPLPGDLYAHNWAQAGVSSVDLVDKLVNYAIERYDEATLQAKAFDTNYLKQF